jgi:predicted GH43/DUF377 family glycosyl hydrolase
LRPIQYKLILFFCSFASLSYAVLVDFEATPHPAVLELKRIQVPGHPYAFNPSFVRWGGLTLMSFRVIPGNKKTFDSEIGLLWLTDNFEPLGEPYFLSFRDPHDRVPSRAEDGRLLLVGDKLYLIYSDCPEAKVSRKGFRVHIGELSFDGERFWLSRREPLLYFEGESPERREKNWIPFDYGGQLYLAYSIQPHRIFRPWLGTCSCETVAFTTHDASWPWGWLSGGTPALLLDGQYLALFHSWTPAASVHSQGETTAHYFIGAYTFSMYPPFAVTRISPTPITAPGMYSGQSYSYYWKPVQAVFPCGLIAEGPYLWVAYGRQDHETWVMKLDKQKLLDSLVPVRSFHP